MLGCPSHLGRRYSRGCMIGMTVRIVNLLTSFPTGGEEASITLGVIFFYLIINHSNENVREV